MDDTYATQFRDSLINSTVYVIVIAFMIVFLIILMWVFSIIHPLNLIRDYIEQIKDGKEVELHLNRDDEIGEMANAIVNTQLKISLTGDVFSSGFFGSISSVVFVSSSLFKSNISIFMFSLFMLQ